MKQPSVPRALRHRLNLAIAGLMAALLTFSSSSAEPASGEWHESPALEAPIDPGLGELLGVQLAIPHEQDDAVVSFSPNGTAYVANPAYAPIAVATGFQLVVLDFPMNADVAAITVHASGTQVAWAFTEPISKGLNTEAESLGFDVYPNVAIAGVPVIPGNTYTLHLLSASGEVLHETGPLALTHDNAEASGYWMPMPSQPGVQWGNGTIGNASRGSPEQPPSQFGNSTMGDAASPEMGSTSTMSASGPSSSYTWCANQDQYCSFTGTRNVAYGANGQFYYRYNVIGGINCSHTIFGDPIYGTVKACYISGDTGTTYTPPSGYTTLCAYETQYCTAGGTVDIAYGNSGSYYYKYGVTGGATCTFTNFGGDPIYGVHKACWTKPAGGNPSTTYTPPSGYSVLCAYENQYCGTYANMDVAYGNSGAYYYKYGISGTSCTFTAFGGDPIYGVHKACWAKPSSTSNCSDPGPYDTWATQTLGAAPYNTYGNTLNTNHGHLISEAWTNSWDYGYYAGTCGHTLGDDKHLGFATDFSGKSDLVGRGIFGYTYTVDYRGFRDMVNTCVGGTCQLVGGSASMSQAEMFLKTPPSSVVPTYRGVLNVGIPQNSGGPPQSEWAWVKYSMDAMATAISTWGGIPGTILGFANPNYLQWQTYNSVTTNNVGSTGGGLRVNTQVYGDQKVVGGQMDWSYDRISATPIIFNYETQPTIKEDSMFHACYDCNWVEDHTTWYTNLQHKAQFRLA